MNDSRAIWFLALGETIFWAGAYYIFPALIVRWEVEFGWSKPEITAALTMALITSAVVSPLFGRLIDRGYGPVLLAGGGFFGALFIASLSMVNSLAAFYVIWSCLGACMAACLYEPCFAIVMRAKGAEAKRAITLITLVAGLAGTISFPVSHIISDYAGWRAAALTFAGVIFFVGVPLVWFGARALEMNSEIIRNEIEKDQPEIREGRFRFLLEAKFWLLAAGFTLLYMNHNAVINHLLLLLKDRKFDADTAVLVATFIGPMQVLGRMTMMFAERYVSNAIVTTMCFVFVMISTASLMGAATMPALLIVFIVLQGSGVGVMSIMRPVMTQNVLGSENFGLKSGAQAVPYLLGSAFAGFIGSLIWNVGGYDLVLQALFIAPVVGLACFLGAVWFSKEKCPGE